MEPLIVSLGPVRRRTHLGCLVTRSREYHDNTGMIIEHIVLEGPALELEDAVRGHERVGYTTRRIRGE